MVKFEEKFAVKIVFHFPFGSAQTSGSHAFKDSCNYDNFALSEFGSLNKSHKVINFATNLLPNEKFRKEKS